MDSDILPATWQDAFQKQSVSSIRAAEKQLRGSVLRDREKLRDLVGNNYRELLSTAEKIVTLSDQTRTAEFGISNLSQACKPRNIEASTRIPQNGIASAAQLKFLDSILRCASRATKAKALLPASKLLVISRLLLKHLEDSKVGTQTVQWLQTRVKVARQQLIVAINSTMAQPTASSKGLAQAIVAYCLITSSPSADALKYFQELRAQKIAQASSLDKSSKVRRQLLKAKCHYLIATIVSLRTLSGRVVNDLLNDVQKRPILEGDDIVTLETLQMDLHQPLLPADIVAFTPYFKRATPTSSELRSSAQAWVDSTFSNITTDIESLVANLKLPAVLKLRHEILDILLPSCFTAFLHQSPLSKLRSVFTARIVQLVGIQAKIVTSVADKALNTQAILHQEPFWKGRVIQSEKVRSVDEHIIQLRRHHLGLHDNLQVTIRGLQKWASGCDMIQRELQSLEKTRWRDKLEDFDDEDEEEAQSLISDLSKADPELYASRFNAVLREACDTFVKLFVESAIKTSADTSSGLDTSSIVNLLRLGREVRAILDTLLRGYESTELVQAISNLQNALAQRTSGELFGMTEVAKSSATTGFSTEDLPSPLTISVLQNLASIMLKNGGIDLWTPNVNTEIRRLVFQRATSVDHRNYYARGEFDLCYLTAALGQKYAQTLDSTDSNLRSSSEPEVDIVASKDSTNARATAYWKRTKALFGIFAPA